MFCQDFGRKVLNLYFNLRQIGIFMMLSIPTNDRAVSPLIQVIVLFYQHCVVFGVQVLSTYQIYTQIFHFVNDHQQYYSFNLNPWAHCQYIEIKLNFEFFLYLTTLQKSKLILITFLQSYWDYSTQIIIQSEIGNFISLRSACLLLLCLAVLLYYLSERRKS